MRLYLSEIYRLSDKEQLDDNNYVSTSSLADVLSVSPPAVNRMINRMKDIQLIEHEPYQGIRLTQTGQSQALSHIRAHRIAEVFLMTVMDFSWDEIYDEAAQMSSVMSDMVVNRMAAMAGNPSHCPHGEPIPQEDGQIETMHDLLLADVEPQTQVMVTRMRTREADRLNYIQALGLMPQCQLEVIHKAPFNGPMQLKIGDEYRIIGHNLAEIIRVRPT